MDKSDLGSTMTISHGHAPVTQFATQSCFQMLTVHVETFGWEEQIVHGLYMRSRHF